MDSIRVHTVLGSLNSHPDRRSSCSLNANSGYIREGLSCNQELAKAGLLRLRNPILRGPLTAPLLADMYPEQQVRCTLPSANFNNTYLRVTQVVHRFSANGFITEVSLSDNFTNSQPLEQWKLVNALFEMGENAYFSRQLADLKSATLDPTFLPLLDPY